MLKLLRLPVFQFGVGILAITALLVFLIPGSIGTLLSPGFFMPHRHCYLDNPRMLWLQGLSDFLIGISYMGISGGLAYLVRRARKDIPFEWVFLAFGLFIFSCGWTHFMEVWTLWHPTYWLSGVIKAITALASVATAVGIFPLIPRVFGLIEAAKAAERHRQELEIAHREMAALNEKLAAANRELEAFSYSVSHDLRAPLRHMMGFAQMLDRSAGPTLDQRNRRYLGVIDDAAKRMEHLIDDLLTFSRIGRSAMEAADVNLGQQVEEARQVLAPMMEGRVIEWKIGTLPIVRADPNLMRSVVVNLLSNAIKYSKQRTPARIEIGSEQKQDELVVFVRDNGAGFDMRFVDKLFGVFQRLHRPEDFEGTGIGLANVRRIIQRHGGRTWAEGAVDQGATFYFSLPIQSRNTAV